MAAALFEPIVKLLARHGILRAVRNDPKKAGILSVLGLIMIALWVRLMLNSGPTLAPASLAPLQLKGIVRSDNPSPMEQTTKALRDWLSTPVAPISRNLFAVHLEYFPSDGSQAVRTPNDGGFWDDLAKSVRALADERGKRQHAKDQIMLEAAQLRVESTLMGDDPKAIINGQLVREGDEVASFRVLKIEARGITVEQKGIKLEIQFDASH